MKSKRNFIEEENKDRIGSIILGAGVGLLGAGTLILRTYYQTTNNFPRWIQYCQEISDKLPSVY